MIESWLEGDPEQVTPPKERYGGRNASGDWMHLFNRDIISMPDKWEYPWVSYCTYLCDCISQFALAVSGQVNTGYIMQYLNKLTI